jgi:hypothetical protein
MLGVASPLTPEQHAVVYDAIVAVLMDRFDDPFSGDPVLSEAQARLIAGLVRERLD